MKKHRVTIYWNENTRSWDVECSACECSLKDFGSDGLAEQGAERYHDSHKTQIDTFKYRR